MGQKSNPYSLKSNHKNSKWSSTYIEKTSSETSLLISQDLNIKNYLNRFFFIHGLILCEYYMHRTPKNINIFLNYFFNDFSSKFFKITKTKKKFKIYVKKKLKKKKRKKIYKVLKKFIKRPGKFFNTSIKNRSILILRRKIHFYHKLLNKHIIIKKSCFVNKLFTCLNLFLNKKYNIKLILKNINKGLSFRLCNKESFLFRKSILKLRFYTQCEFFEESINLLIYSIRKNYTAKLLSEFLSLKLSGLKKHNFFLTFIRRTLILLVNSKYSHIKGIKIRIAGRFNGASRARKRIFKICKMPVQTFSAPLDFNQSVSYTNNGTFGIKVWISY